MDSHDVSEYLAQRKANSTFDVLFLFHLFNFRTDYTLLDYYHSKIKEKTSDRMRFATAFYTQNINGPNYFEISQFKDFKNSNTKYFYNPNEIKSYILNLDWNEKSHKLVVTLTKEGVIESLINFLFPSVNLANILSNEDEVTKQIRYKNIHFKRVDFKKNQVDQSIINQIFSEHFLSVQAEDLCQEDYLRELYFLKRKLFTSSIDYKKSRKEKLFQTKYDKLKYLRICSDYQTFKKASEYDYVKCERTSMINLKVMSDVLEPTRNLYLTSASCNEGKCCIWIEIFDDESSLKRILDIHLTAVCLVNYFKMQKSSSLKINIAKINQLLFDPLEISKLATFISIDEDLSRAEIKTPSESVYEVMQCFTHFTYEKTNRTLMVIDLRTLHLRNEFVITEPVVFSTIPERFSSSNLGLRGIEDFKSQHKCNAYCKEIGLKAF
jgi:hypothetical protein